MLTTYAEDFKKPPQSTVASYTYCDLHAVDKKPPLLNHRSRDNLSARAEK